MKSRFATALAAALFLITGVAATAQGQTLRVVTYNLDADTGGADGAMGGYQAGPGLTAVLQAIGNEHLNGHAQPIDVLALEELHYDNPSVSSTLTWLLGQLNSPSMYGAGAYAIADSNVVDPTTGDLTGNGPNGLIYNTHTVVDLGATAIGSVSGSGAPRAPMRYSLKPVGGAAYTQFYVYVSHAKASSGSDNANRRNIEAGELRTNAATLGTDAHIIYTGDFNIQSSSEQTYQTLIGSSPSPGQAIDTANPTNDWAEGSNASLYSKFWPLLSESATSLTARFDLQLVTSPVTTLPGLQLVPGTLTPFGNNGSITYNHSVTTSTALSDLSNRTTILNDLTTDTDHLPVVADYTIVPPGDFNRDGQVNAADIGAMLAALTNVSGYETATGLNDHQVQLIGDVNGDGKFNNADVQALVNFLKTGHGTESAVPEPASMLLLALAIPFFAGRLCRCRWTAGRGHNRGHLLG